jgi:hypothetical protein
MTMSLLDEVYAAHGGFARWAEVRVVTLDLRIGGNILATRFTSPRARALQVTVDARRIHATLRPFPRSGQVGVFEADRVRIETDDGRVVAERSIARDDDGRVVRRLVWDDLDVLYFLGYALWNYTVTPFLFAWPGFECRESGEWREPDGSVWRTLTVTAPRGFPTHCREQAYYFDRQGLLRRLDYTAEVFSHLARGAHLCEAHRTFDGFVWPTHRVVYFRRANRMPVRLVSVMEGWITSVAVQFADRARAT